MHGENLETEITRQCSGASQGVLPSSFASELIVRLIGFLCPEEDQDQLSKSV